MDPDRPSGEPGKYCKGKFAPKPLKKVEDRKIDEVDKGDTKTQESAVGTSNFSEKGLAKLQLFNEEHLAGEGSKAKKKKEYEEPWDYENSNYPITLPLRRPNSGDPELLDKAEFEEAPEYDEDSVSCASHLGLLVDPGLDCSFAQTVMAINTTEKHCCELGTVEKKAIVPLDVDSLLQNQTDESP